jgi:uncharacterized protein
MTFTLSELWIYPLKSGAALPVAQTEVLTRGLMHDRRWMVVDADGRFLTGRQIPRLTQVRATLVENRLRLDAPGCTTLLVDAPTPRSPRLGVVVWRDHVDAVACAPAADAWLSEFLGRPVRLAHMDEVATRGVDPTYAWAGDEVSFADGFPMLLISEASLAGLNARLLAPVPMTRFRPNFVVAGCEAHAEDSWRRIQIGFVEFDVVKACTRCVFTTVDTERGEFDASGEPLNTLKSYRRSPTGITFGQNLIPRSGGTISLRDPIRILE